MWDFLFTKHRSRPESVGLDRLHPGFSEPRVYSHLIQWSIRNYWNIQSHKLKLHPSQGGVTARARGQRIPGTGFDIPTATRIFFLRGTWLSAHTNYFFASLQKSHTHRHLRGVLGDLQHSGERIAFDSVELLAQCRIRRLYSGRTRFPILVLSVPFG